LTAATVLAAGRLLTRAGRLPLLLTTACAAAAVATRYVGVALVLAVAVALVALRSWRAAVTFTLGAVAPAVVFVVGIAIAGGGNARLVAWHPSGAPLTGGLEIIGKSIVPTRWPDALAAVLAIVLLGLTLDLPLLLRAGPVLLVAIVAAVLVALVARMWGPRTATRGV
jgi:hypothetical protein